jgi:predicted protein tyrosine phosphatase
MDMQVEFCSRINAECRTPDARWALISLNEPDAWDGLARIAPGWHSVLQLSFHDVTPESHGLDALITFFSEEDARQVVDFVRRVAQEVDGILVHCRAGVSRSAAVAKWISGEYRIPFDRHYKHFNKHVYQLLIAAGKAK